MGVMRALRLVRDTDTNGGVIEAAALNPVRREILSPWQPEPNQLQSIVWADILGLANVICTRAEAMQIPAVAKGRHVIAPKIAGAPVRAIRFDAATSTDVPQPTPYFMTRTDRSVSPWHRMTWTVDDLIFYGWSLWRCERGADGFPLWADRVNPQHWSFDDNYNVTINDKPVDQSTVVLIPGPHEGIVNFGRVAIRHARQLLDAAAKAGATPSPTMELHQTAGDPLLDDEIDELVDGWAKARTGANGGVGFTNQSIETKEHKSIDGALLIDGRNAAAVEMARILGISAAMVDATVPKSSLTYETTKGRGLEHTEYGTEPYSEAIAARLSMDDIVPRGWRQRFDIAEDIAPEPTPTGPTSIED